MAYGVKYWTSYRRRSGNTTTIHILERDYSGAISYLRADKNPLTINITGDVNNIYKPTQGSGATIRLVVNPLTFLDLFTVDPQKYMVKVFNGTSGSTITWQGFVSPGIYSEDYSVGGTLKTPVEIQCNDGMAVLEDIPYRASATGATYSGFVEIYEVMDNIFSKLGIEFTSIITSNNLYIADYTTDPFLYLTVNNENYIDEKGETMSCRKVLDSIFGAMGLVMTFRGQTIYLIDPINLHDTNNGISYATSPIYGAYEDRDYSFGGYLDISNGDIGYYETGQRMDIVQPYNQVIVKYDPYNLTAVSYDFNDEDNVTNPGTYGTYTDGDITYNVYSQNEMEGWYTSAFSKFEGFQLSGDTPSNIDYVIRQTDGGSGYFSYTFPYSNIKQDESLRLELSMDIYVNTKHQSNLWSKAAGTLVQEVKIPVYIKVGDQWYGGGNTWQTGQTSTTMTVRTPNTSRVITYKTEGWWFWKHNEMVITDESVVNDTWTTARVELDMGQSHLEDLISGSIYVYVPKEMTLEDVTPLQAEASIYNLLIKNIGVQPITTSKVPITNQGIQIKATLYNYDTIKKSPIEFTLTNGCGNYGVSKAAFSTMQQVVQGTNITGLSRDEGATYYDTARLLAQSLISQYSSPRIKLKVNLDVEDYLLDVQNYLIKDSDYLGSRAFYIVNGTYNDDEESMEVEMMEITSTRVSI